jgi:hypothetical protein
MFIIVYVGAEYDPGGKFSKYSSLFVDSIDW